MRNCHDHGPEFISAHNDLEKIFSCLVWKLFEAHVVDVEQIAFEIFVETGIGFEGAFELLKVPDDIEDGAVGEIDAGFISSSEQMTSVRARISLLSCLYASQCCKFVGIQ